MASVSSSQGAAQLFRVQDGIAAHVQQHQPRADGGGQTAGVSQRVVGGLVKIGEHEQRKSHDAGGFLLEQNAETVGTHRLGAARVGTGIAACPTVEAKVEGGVPTKLYFVELAAAVGVEHPDA